MNITKKEIHSLITELKENAELFYQQKQSEAFLRFSVLLEKLTVITQAIFEKKNEGTIKEFDEYSYIETLKEAMKALEDKDSVLLADVLTYDLTDFLVLAEKQL